MHFRYCPKTSVLEEQVDSIGDRDHIVDPTNLSMHAVHMCNLVGQGGLDKIVSELPVQLFVAFSPVDKGISKILKSQFDLRVPVVPWCTAGGSAFVEGRVRRASHRLIRSRRCFRPVVYVDNVMQIVNGGIRLRHNCRVA